MNTRTRYSRRFHLRERRSRALGSIRPARTNARYAADPDGTGLTRRLASSNTSRRDPQHGRDRRNSTRRPPRRRRLMRTPHRPMRRSTSPSRPCAYSALTRRAASGATPPRSRQPATPKKHRRSPPTRPDTSARPRATRSSRECQGPARNHRQASAETETSSISRGHTALKWGGRGSNPRPTDYESLRCAPATRRNS